MTEAYNFLQSLLHFAKMPAASRAYCFTWNNYDNDTLAFLASTVAALDTCSYLIYGKEVAPTTGTPHLQGYVCFTSRRTFPTIRELLRGAHVSIARGTPEQNREYCAKDGDYQEFGSLPTDIGQGKRTDIERYIDWLKNFDGWPTERTIMLEFPCLYIRYSDMLMRYRALLCEAPPLQEGELNPWQELLHDKLLAVPANDREIDFYIDPLGGTGKSWFVRYMISKYPNDVQMLGIGKRDDLAYAIDVSKKIFLVTVPRSSMEFLNYSVLEMIKDRLIFSPKYQSQMKRIDHPVHVVVFCNEEPDRSKLTLDRFNVVQLSTVNNVLFH